MHYYIDGYNLLFNYLHHRDTFQNQRDQIIEELSEKLKLVALDITIVFDAHYQLGEGTRSHFRDLEIFFTSQGETADDFILDRLKESKKPHTETVVTSDKKLAWLSKKLHAQTQSIEDFILWLNRLYKNKLKGNKLVPKVIPKPIPKQTNQILPQHSSPSDRLHFYEQLFESKFHKLMKEEKIRSTELKGETPQKRQRKKIPQDPFLSENAAEDKTQDDMERWLKIFEHKSKKEGH